MTPNCSVAPARLWAIFRRSAAAPFACSGNPVCATAAVPSTPAHFCASGASRSTARPREFPRIFVHELFHFVWLRAGNPRRWSFERVVRGEFRSGARGELGWSAEWRKAALRAGDVRRRSRRWREYCCESFCDTAAWLYSGVIRHPEFTLAAPSRKTSATVVSNRNWSARGLSI